MISGKNKEKLKYTVTEVPLQRLNIAHQQQQQLKPADQDQDQHAADEGGETAAQQALLAP